MMKKNIKGIAAVAVALVLVISAGAYMADHNLKATDGDENVVENMEEGENAGNSAETETALVEMASEDAPREEAAPEETTADETAADETAADETTADETTADETTADETTADDTKTADDADTSETEEAAECTEHVDEDGDGLCDKCGAEMPKDAEKEAEEEKTVGTVKISSNVDASQPIEKGTKITLTATTEGFKGGTIHYQWMRTQDGSTWENIEGANSSKYTFEMNEDNNGYQWKVRVTLED